MLSRRKPLQVGLGGSLILAMLFLIGFAFGLRWIDQRHAPALPPSVPLPARDEESPVSQQLTAGLRFVLGIKTAQAAEFDQTRYKASPVEKTVTVTAPPGGTATVTLKYVNFGSATWKPEGKGFISVYTTQPRYHAGVFRDVSWLAAGHPAKLATASVPTGKTGIVTFNVKAPAKEGMYIETMQLAAEDTAWVWGAQVKVVLNVKKGIASAPPSSGGAMLLIKSAQKITAAANQAVSFTAGFKNTGVTSWTERGLRLKEGPSEIRHASWSSADIPIRVIGAPIAPGQVDLLNFVMTTPRKKGDYVVKLGLVTDNKDIADAFVEIPITVTSDAPDFDTPSSGAPTPGTPPADAPPIVSENGVEPTLRVGLYTTERFEEISFDGPFEARDTNGGLLGSFPAGARLQFSYDASAALYRVTNGIANLSSSLPIRFVPLNAGDIFTLWSHEDRPSWNTSINYNRYRGILEMRKNDRNAYVWIINELPMEDYLKGMKETSNASPLEFQKALVAAARSYANWHYQHPGKHWHFTVDATYDQVYKGYVAEQQIPKLTQAVDATRGQVVAYNGELVVTPYFSWSDGRTRAWTEVWGGGAKPWLVSVPTPHDAGKTLFGHGVGMSAWDAIGRANDGASYDTIVKYYYTGTELKKLY